ncbi:nucleoside deaminase [candidate division FCPU426 bacterium]|nr:nucleoside deaminase [candidate division FCPU426 bacterium]
MGMPQNDEYFMTLALREARKAFLQQEVPVGAIVVFKGKVIGRGHNRMEQRQDASYHAELTALRQAARRLGQWRLADCELYVTLEPCAMCAGAMVWARIKRVVYGAKDPKAGADGSVVRILGNRKLNHRPGVRAGVFAQQSRELLQTFFRQLRKRKRRRAQ